MVSDLKIEIFAYNLFYMFWHAADEIKTKPNILKMFGEESKEVDFEEICDEWFFVIICFRHSIFNQIYEAEFTDEIAKSLKSTYGCYKYVVSTCDRHDLFGHLTIFQRMFATLNFVQFICLRLRNKSENAIDVVKYGYLFWAMYFDKYTEEFYKKGEWNELRKEIKLYVKLNEFSWQFSNDKFNIVAIKKGCFNYRHFKNAYNYQEQKQKHPVHISYLWIKSRIEHFQRPIKIPLSYETSVSVCEAEQLLEDLKLLLNPATCNPDDVESSKEKNQGFNFSTEFHSASEVRKSHQDGETQIQQLCFEYENRIADKIPFGVLHKGIDLKDESLKDSQTFNTEELIPDIVPSNLNEELHENTFREMELPKQTSRVDATTISTFEPNQLRAAEMSMKKKPEISLEHASHVSGFELKHSYSSESYTDKKEDSTTEYFYDNKRQDEIATKNQLISKYKVGEIEGRKQTCLRDHDRSTLSEESVNNFNRKVNSGKQIEIKDDSNTEKESGFSNTIDVVYTNHIGTSDFDGLSLLKDLRCVKETDNSDDERKRIRKAREDFRKEREDPKVNTFLKLLLVLGDKENAEFALSTLQCKEETPLQSQESSNKQKKRSKKKKHRK